MKFILHEGNARYRIRGYERGAVTVNDERLTRSFVLSPEHIVHDWPPASVEALCRAHFAAIVDLGPEVILLGTGARLRFPDNEQLAHLVATGIGFEVMDTPAACRTFNVLMSEGRQVVAALIVP